MKKLLLCLLFATSCAHADPQVTSTITACPMLDANRVAIPGVTASTREITAVQKLRDDDSLYDGTYYCQIEHKLVKTGNPKPTPTPTPTPEPTPTPTPTPDPNEPTTTPQDYGIVYSRVPRSQGPITSELGYTLQHPDLWDSLPEVQKLFYGFNAPGQLVWRKPDGSEQVIYDCFTKPKPCVPYDSSVSLDGTKIAFAVYRADDFQPPWPQNKKIPSQMLGKTNVEAQIYIYDFLTGTTTAWPHLPGEYETSPVWLPNGRIMFSSTRDGHWRPWLDRITPQVKVDPRLFTAKPDGSDVVDITPHEVGSAIHPYLLDNGRVLYSSLWYSHNLPYVGTNGSINWPTTLDNMWMVSDMTQWGSDMTAIIGSHRNSIKDSNGRTKNMKAFHFFGQRLNGDACSGNYYRGNNMGLGEVWCWTPEPKLLEGPAPNFLPTNTYNVADWSESNDQPSRKDANGKYMGKAAFPEGAPDGQLYMTVGRGYCTSVAITPTTEPSLGNQPGCDVGIYKTTVIPSKTLDDMQLVVDSPLWHEFNERVIKPRAVPNDPMETTSDGSCVLASSDAGSTDALFRKPYQFNDNYFNMANNGSIIDGIDHSEMTGIRFYEVLPNHDNPPTFKNSIGNEVAFIGDVSLLGDKSFSVQLPCDTPYLMAGVDAKGRLIKRDQVTMSLRPGEKRVCTGCHLHGSEGRPYELSQAYTAVPVKLLTPEPVPTFTADIAPILQSKCASCHTADLPLDYDGLVWDYKQERIPHAWRVQVSTSTNDSRRYGLQRPQTSKYVNNMFARESLLYWKAANERTDGRTDATYDDDIDFGADHPTSITPAELKTIAAWLDSGAAE